MPYDELTLDDLPELREALVDYAGAENLSAEFRDCCRSTIRVIDETLQAALPLQARLQDAVEAYVEAGQREVLLHVGEAGTC